MTDILGPADAGAARTVTTTTDVSSPAAGDSWFADCVAGVAGTGTPIVARWLNRLLQQERRLVRNSGVAESNADDDMLSKAVQSGALNWAGLFGGSANALTATLAPTPVTLPPGTVISGLIASANTGAVTLNVDGIGAQAVAMTDGSALSGGELQPGLAEFVAYSGGFYLRSTVTWDKLHSQYIVSSTMPATGSFPFIWRNNGSTTFTTPAGPYGAVSVPPGGFATWDGGAWYPFPNIASTTRSGSVIVGAGLSVASDGTLSANPTSLPVATTSARGIARQATTGEASAGVTTGSAPAFITPEELAAAIAAISSGGSSFNPFTATGVGAVSMMSGTASPGSNPAALLGQSFSFASFGGLDSASIGGFVFYHEDNRWGTSGVTPGTWVVQTVFGGSAGGTGVNATAQIVVLRTA